MWDITVLHGINYCWGHFSGYKFERIMTVYNSIMKKWPAVYYTRDYVQHMTNLY